MKRIKIYTLMQLVLLALIPAFTKAQTKISKQKLVEGHNESISDPYLPNEFQNKKLSPGYKFRTVSKKAKARLANSPSIIYTTQVNIDSLGQNIIGDAANETSIAVHPLITNQISIGWRQFDNVLSNFRQAGWSFSLDSGQTWTFPGVLEPGVFRSDPVLDFDLTGNFYYNSLTNTPDYFCKVFKSTNGGASWDIGTDAAGGDKQWMAIDRTVGTGTGNIYSAWNASYSTCIPYNATRSANAGNSFEPCVYVDNDPIWGTMTVNNAGELFVAGRSLVSDSLLVIKSANANIPSSTINWTVSSIYMDGYLSAGTTINPAGLPGQVNIEVDNSTGAGEGNLYLLAPLARISNFDPGDIIFSSSTDNGATWTAPLRINDDSSATNFQWFGTMSVAPNGRIDVIWLDTRDAPTGSDSSALYYSYSTDEGITWSPNEKLSASFDPHLGYPNQNKMGDYFDMISDEDGAHLAWANTLNGEQDAYYSRIIPSISTTIKKAVQDVYTVFPNPGNGIYELRGNLKNVSIEVYSAIGEQLLTQPSGALKKIDISTQPLGIYFLKIIDLEGRVVVKKLIRN